MDVATGAVYSSVVVGTDGSPTAQRAVTRAVAVAGSLGVPLILATAWYRDMPDEPVLSTLVQYPGGSPGAMEAAWAEHTVSAAAGGARTTGLVDVEGVTPVGNPADALIGLAARHPGSLLVVGTVGLGSRAERMLGNVPHQITHHAISDALLVRTTHGDVVAGYRTVALATDGSPTAAIAVARGLAMARALGATPVLLTAARSEAEGGRTLEAVANQLADPGVERAVVTGRHPASTLADAAPRFDLLVLGNKGMSGPSRLLGSVANDVTHLIPTDLLLVNTTGRTAAR